jgi:hypothetical protein
MRKLFVLVPAFVLLAHCDLLKKGDGATADGGVTTTASSESAATTATATVLDKALSFLSGGPFQGSITMTITNAGKPPETMVYMVKGTKMRFNTPVGERRGGGGYVIADTTTNTLTTVMDAQKMAMVVDMSSAAGGKISAIADAKKPTSIDRSGKTDTVAGYSCDVVTLTEANGDKGEACIAKGISYPKMGATSGWMNALNDSFPLRSVIHDPAGTEKLRMEVTKIDKTPIDDSQFEVPAGYKTTSMEDMIKGMGGGRPPH